MDRKLPHDIVADLRAYAATHPVAGRTLESLIKEASGEQAYEDFYEIVASSFDNNLADVGLTQERVWDMRRIDVESVLACDTATFLRALNAADADGEFDGWYVKDGEIGNTYDDEDD